ncbi:MAG TPA: ASKHA domain-containing protein, partial [Geobacteraceae bacterium]
MSLSERLAIAVDLGTTTIAASLVEPTSGRRLALAGSLNPQRPFGADVIARLTYATSGEGNLAQLGLLVNGELARLVAELCRQADIEPGQIGRVAIAGNPTMSHLLLGLPVDSLARPPYRPRQTGGHDTTTGSLGWELDVPVYVFPSPGGFVGGDTVAFLYGQGVASHQSPVTNHRLYLDFGTNGEIALTAGGQLLATAAAAGPAFEGGNLACGMAALPGAIDRVWLADERLVWSTVGGAVPTGICGSGVLDTIALLLGEGLMDLTGRLLEAAEAATSLADRLQRTPQGHAFVLYRDAARQVFLSQEDIRQVQLAKAAIRAGIQVLLARAGIGAHQVDEVVITGSFGVTLAAAGLKSVGIITENMVRTSRFVREGALAGVEKALCS